MRYVFRVVPVTSTAVVPTAKRRSFGEGSLYKRLRPATSKVSFSQCQDTISELKGVKREGCLASSHYTTDD